MKTHTVRQGECLSSIAARYGFSWETLYNAPENEDFRRRRPNPNLLYPGDVLVIPDRLAVGRTVPTGAQHTFRVHRQRKRLYVEFRHLGEPEVGVPYVIRGAAATPIEGVTDAHGAVNVLIPANVDRVELRCLDRTYDVHVGHLDPLDTNDEGARSERLAPRLRNLGIDLLGLEGEARDHAIAQLQATLGLPITGALDDAMLQKLEDWHGC